MTSLTRLPNRLDVAIVGGGIVGLCLAVELRRLGVRRVAVLERDLAGSGSTGRAAGGIRRQFGSAIEIEMTLASLPVFDELATDPEYVASYEPVGYAFLAGPEQVDGLRAAWSLQREHGVAVCWLDRDDLPHRFPYCDCRGLVAGTICLDDGFIDPHYVVAALLRRCRAVGVEVCEQAPVEEIEIVDRALRAVVAGGQRIASDIVVNAAGAWAGMVGELAGVALPVQPSPRQKFLTDPRPELPRDMPLVMDLTTGAYVRSDRGRAIVGVRPPRQVTGFDLTVDYDLLGWMAARASRRFPSLRSARAQQVLVGLYEVTPDGLPLVGPVPGVAGFYVAAGFSGHGIMHGPGVARALAETIVTGASETLDLARLAPSRFGADGEGSRQEGIHLL
jgi:sarcosine oxidase subunit beta